MDLEQALAKIAQLEKANVGMEDRMKQAIAQAKDARVAEAEALKQVQDLEGKIGDQTKAAKAHESVRAELDAIKAERSAWETERALMGAGLTDPEGMDFARIAYGRIAEADRPKGGIVEWIGGERDNLPKALHPYLPERKAEGQGQGQGQGAGNQGQPGGQQQRATHDANGGARAYTGAGGQFDAARIGSMTLKDWAAQREAAYASMGIAAESLPVKGGS